MSKRGTFPDTERAYLRPEIGRRRGPRQDRDTTFKRIVLRHLGRLAGGPGGARSVRRSAPRDVRTAPAWSRRCVIKARYVQMDAHGARKARLHLDYIEREGVERDGTRGRLFDASGDIERNEFATPIAPEERQYRFIVSPEDGAELDLRDYTRRLVARVEKDMGQRLRWAAVCHYNTDNPHVHLVVRGIDREGSRVRFQRAYISEFMRSRAQELATLELGPRNELDISRQLSRDVSAERLTSIDRRLAELATTEDALELSKLGTVPRLSREHAMARLQTLERFDLAERVSSTRWRLRDGWQETLRAMGERGDIIKRMHAALRMQPERCRVFDPAAATGSVEGIVKRKGLHDELGEEVYAIVQTPRGPGYYVRLDHVTAETFREGDRVRVRTVINTWVKGIDHLIQRTAGANGGVYDPGLHLRELGDKPVFAGGRYVQPRDLVQGSQRRLDRLARYKLAEGMPEGTWRVPPDLVEQLRTRERTHPRHRVQVERLERDRDRDPDLGPGFGF